MKTTKQKEKAFAKRLKQLRRLSKWSTSDIAFYLDIDEQKYLDWENSITFPNCLLITKLSELFMVEEYDFFTNKKVTPMKKNMGRNDMKQIAHFYKVVRNYIKMTEVLK